MYVFGSVGMAVAEGFLWRMLAGEFQVRRCVEAGLGVMRRRIRGAERVVMVGGSVLEGW